MTVLRLGRSGAASLFLNQDFGFEEGTDVVGTLVGYAHFDGLDALVTRGGIEVKAVSTRVQIRAAIPALFGHLDPICNLNFSRAIVAASNQMKSRFDASSGPLRTRWRFRLSFTVIVLIAVLTILSAHFPPQKRCYGEDLPGRDTMNMIHILDETVQMLLAGIR
jgi:hypothetical protein